MESETAAGSPTKTCPFCAVEVPETAIKCRHCAEPLDIEAVHRLRKELAGSVVGANEDVLFKGNPSMFRNHPVGFVTGFLVLAAGLAFAVYAGGKWADTVRLVTVGAGLAVAAVTLVGYLVWWLTTKYTLLTVTTRRTKLREGILDKHTNDILHEDVRNIQVTQTFFQRLFGVGTVAVSSAGQAEMELEVNGIENPTKVKELIDRYR